MLACLFYEVIIYRSHHLSCTSLTSLFLSKHRAIRSHNTHTLLLLPFSLSVLVAVPWNHVEIQSVNFTSPPKN